MRRLRFIGPLALALVVAATACSDSASTEPAPAENTKERPTGVSAREFEDFFRDMIEFDLRGEHGLVWDSLHPGQQELVPRATYIACRERRGDGHHSRTVISVKLWSSYPPTTVVGVPEKSPIDVTARATVVGPDPRKQSLRRRFLVLPLEQRVVWVLPSDDLRTLRAGECPS